MPTNFGAIGGRNEAAGILMKRLFHQWVHHSKGHSGSSASAELSDEVVDNSEYAQWFAGQPRDAH
jgi:hypothetical protein